MNRKIVNRVTRTLVAPYGGRLVDLLVSDKKEQSELLRYAIGLPDIRLTLRSLQDLELMAVGAFSPLDRFMSHTDYRRVLDEVKLANGMVFPIPITLPVHNRHSFREGRDVALRSPANDVVAIMTIEEIYTWDLRKEATTVYGTLDSNHPLVSEMVQWGTAYASGPLRVLELPKYYDFPDLRHTPKQLRAILARIGRPRVVAYQTRNPMHRVHEELTKRAAKKVNGTLLLHPTIGLTKPDDIDTTTRVHTYQAMYQKYYNSASTVLSLIPLAMRFAGPREAVWHAIIRRNYGANYFIVGRDHASPGLKADGKPFYSPYGAQVLLEKVKEDIGVTPVPFEEIVYVPDIKRYIVKSKIMKGQNYHSLSGTSVRTKYRKNDDPLPEWYTRPEVARILAHALVPSERRGFCVWFTGLPCAGKSTIATVLNSIIQKEGRRTTFLDGDIVRTHLSKGLGFTKVDRDANVLRIGFVAAEIVKHHGVAICAAVSPYENTRSQVRNLMPEGSFILIYVNTPLSVCKKRDQKGLYKKALAGEITEFTGVDDVYEPPMRSEVKLTTVRYSPVVNAQRILGYLRKRGFLIHESKT